MIMALSLMPGPEIGLAHLPALSGCGKASDTCLAKDSAVALEY